MPSIVHVCPIDRDRTSHEGRPLVRPGSQSLVSEGLAGSARSGTRHSSFQWLILSGRLLCYRLLYGILT